MRIRIGLPFLDGDGVPHDVASLRERARWIEQAGFSGMWMGDASFRSFATWTDPFLWMLGVATATEKVELGFAKFHRDMETIRRLCGGERVGAADLSPWEQIAGGPRFLLAAWHGGKDLERAANDYDGWLCSAARTTVGTIVDGLARYRDLGGRRAIVASCVADLTARDVSMGKDDLFNLRCPPDEPADRLAWLADLGFDDVLVTIRDGRTAGVFDSDLEHDKLLELRSLFDPAPPYPRAA